MNQNKFYKQIKYEIENMINENKLEEAKIKLKKYEKDIQYDLDIIILKSNIYFLETNYDEAEQILINIYHKYKYNHELNYNLGIIKYYKNKYLESLYHILWACTLNNEYINNSKEVLGSILEKSNKKDYNDVVIKVKKETTNNQRKFPWSEIEEKLLYGEKINNTHYCGIYDHYYDERYKVNFNNKIDYSLFMKSEVIPGENCKEISIRSEDDYIIPIMLKHSYQPVEIQVDDKINVFNYMLKNQFYYYKFDKNTDVKIRSYDDFIAGDKIVLRRDKNKPSLILNIFIDGLSEKFIEDYNLKDIAPNIYNFFDKGTICNNTYTTGEWTYVSLASFFTGKYTTNHRMYHPQYDTDNLLINELYSEIFKKQGYYCAKIDGDWRSNPAIGYTKGFDRYLYQASVRGMHSEDVIIETIEHLETFKEKNNFLWICIPDLHDIADEYETKSSVQVNSSIQCRTFEKSDETSVRKKRDDNKIERYQIQLKRIDTYINILFSYIRDNYDDDDILISLIADHGQGYLVKSDEFLDEERIKIPMMFRGKNIPRGICDELISGVDLMPIILKTIGVNHFDKKDGNIPRYFGGDISRKYVYSESIFPNSPYYAALNDKKYKFFFTTKEVCTNDGRLNIEGYEVSLIEKETGFNKTKDEPEKVLEFTNEVINHIKEYIVI